MYGSFPCGHCAHCPLIRKEKVFTLPNGQVFKLKHFVNCQTPAVVYLMTCECGAFYVGKTRQRFWCRMSKHVYGMEIGNIHLPLGRHMVTQLHYKMAKMYFAALDWIHIPGLGSD